MKRDFVEKVQLEEGYEVNIVRKPGPIFEVSISFQGNKLVREFKTGKKIVIEKSDGAIIIKADKGTKKEKRLIKTITSHIRNMVKGLKEPWLYKLEICHSHFPMTVTVDNNKKQIEIKNFFGESVPRYVKILEGVDIQVKGNIIEVRSHDKELAGRQAALIEQATRITNRDRRIFQDGIWIIEKAGKPI